MGWGRVNAMPFNLVVNGKPATVDVPRPVVSNAGLRCR